MKGVSAIIATILMLIITIGLAGTAYVYISGIMTARTAITLSISDATCEGPDPTDEMRIVVMNDGTSDAAATDLTIYVNGVDMTTPGACTEANVPAHGSSVQVCTEDALDTYFNSGINNILIVHPTSTARGQAFC